MKINKIYNEDCLETMQRMPDNFVDLIVTSPPYNMTKRTDDYNNRYDVYYDNLDEKEYLLWSNKIFNNFDKILNSKGVVLYNFSYSHENPILPYLLINEIHNKTNFTIADTLFWKKNNAIPLSTSPTKLTRFVEFIFVMVRKNELYSFNTNKKIKSINDKTKQNFYEIFPNFINAKNNDGSVELNKATFSSELIRKLLLMYAKEKSLVYDSFMGTGTTAQACIMENMNFLGSELSKKQVDFANKRLVPYLTQTKLF
tara:strand:- start:266 stop:1033 length:768 start_codon:yes stop_codon:yes gene_type:complete